MAKARVRFSDVAAFRVDIGRCVERARLAMGWNLEQFAQACGDKDARQVQRWCTGQDRPQFDVLLAIHGYADELLIELARMHGARVYTRVEFPDRRTA